MEAQATIQLPQELTAMIQTMVDERIAEVMPKQLYPQGSDFMTLGQTCEMLQVSRGTLNKMIKRGDVKVTFINTAKRVSRRQVQEYMDSKAI